MNEPKIEQSKEQETSQADEESKDSRGAKFWVMLGVGGSIGLCILLFIGAIFAGLVSGEWENVASFIAVVRDLFIILLVLEGILIGIALIVMISQLSLLLNVLQNEIKPIVESAQHAADNVRGTSKFMSKHLTGPVIRYKSFVTGSTVFMREILAIRRVVRPRKAKK